MDDYECPKCKRKAVTVKYRERRRLKTLPVWLMEYRWPRGHKWNRVMSPNKPSPIRETKMNRTKLNQTDRHNMKGIANPTASRLDEPAWLPLI